MTYILIMNMNLARKIFSLRTCFVTSCIVTASGREVVVGAVDVVVAWVVGVVASVGGGVEVVGGGVVVGTTGVVDCVVISKGVDGDGDATDVSRSVDVIGGTSLDARIITVC